MSNYSTTKNSIARDIRANGNQEITGQLMQDNLIRIVNAVAQGDLFAGFATPTTIVSDFDANVFYIATVKGLYPNFGGLTVEDEMCVFSNRSGVWQKTAIGVATKAEVDQELGKKIDKTKVLSAYPTVEPADDTTVLSAKQQYKKDNAQDAKKANQSDLVQLEQNVNYRADKILRPKKNLYNKDARTQGYYYDADFDKHPLPNISYSDKIMVKEGVSYTPSHKHNILLLNSKGAFVKSFTAAQYGNYVTIPVGEDITYMIVNVYDSFTNYQIEEGTIKTSYEPYELINDYLKSNSAKVDDTTLVETSGVLGIKDKGVSHQQLSDSVINDINNKTTQYITNNNFSQPITITNAEHIYIATNYINADGNITGKHNTVDEWQSMIDACAVTGGVIYFPDGNYMCKGNKSLLIKPNVHLVGSSVDSVILTYQCNDINTHQFESNIIDSIWSISNMTLIRDFSNELIAPDANNICKRCSIAITKKSKVKLNNVVIRAINLNDGIDVDNYVAAKAAYTAIFTVGGKLDAINCDIDSPAWGLFFNGTSGDVVNYTGNITSWYKSTGIHGIGCSLNITGCINSYGSGGFGAISCSGGITNINGTINRICTINNAISNVGHAVYVGTDDYSYVTINGIINTNCGVISGNDGKVDISGIINYIDNTFSKQSVLFDVGGNNIGCTVRVNSIFDMSCNQSVTFARVDNKGRFYGNITGNIRGYSFVGINSSLNSEPILDITGNIRYMVEFAYRVYQGYLNISGHISHSSANDLIQINNGGRKYININNATIKKNSNDINYIGVQLISPVVAASLIYNNSTDDAILNIFNTTYKSNAAAICVGNNISTNIFSFGSNVAKGNMTISQIPNVQ